MNQHEQLVKLGTKLFAKGIQMDLLQSKLNRVALKHPLSSKVVLDLNSQYHSLMIQFQSLEVEYNEILKLIKTEQMATKNGYIKKCM